MKPIRKVSIVGVGLIGGSLALALKRARPKVTIIGYDRPSTMKKSLERGIIDVAGTDLLSTVLQAECLIFATPILTTIELMRSVGKFIPSGTIVSDVGSVKQPVLATAKKFLPKDVYFVGGHPMTGSERSGVDAADPLLFENAYYILSPPGLVRGGKRVASSAVRNLAKLIESTGARVIYVDGRSHDRIVASVSHLPQLLAVALVNQAKKESDLGALQLAAGGFRDLTRVASSPFDIWEDILRSNKYEVSRSLSRLINDLKKYKTSLDSGKLGKLGAWFSSAKSYRDSIPRDMKGFHRPLTNILISVEDKPGAIGRIGTLLSRCKINIKDMELLKVREGERGTFRLSFESAKRAGEAVRALTKAGFRATKR